MRALDLFCGAGGASMGLHRAGFEVTGVDINPKRGKRYPFRFICGDATNPPVRLEDFDFIWASPPCQHASEGTPEWARDRHPNLIPATRELLSGHPMTVIENVRKAAIRPDVVLEGAVFGLPIARRRHFEVEGFPPPLCLNTRWIGRTTQNGGLACVAGHGANRGRFDGKWSDMPLDLRRRLSTINSKAGWAKAMDIDWMTRDELREAIPPAYSEFIARAALEEMPHA